MQGIRNDIDMPSRKRIMVAMATLPSLMRERDRFLSIAKEAGCIELRFITNAKFPPVAILASDGVHCLYWKKPGIEANNHFQDCWEAKIKQCCGIRVKHVSTCNEACEVVGLCQTNQSQDNATDERDARQQSEDTTHNGTKQRKRGGK